MSDTRKKLLYYGLNYAPELTGIGKYSTELMEHMCEDGWQVSAVVAQPHYPGWQITNPYFNGYSKELINNIEVFRCPIFLSQPMAGIARLLAPLSFFFTSLPIFLWVIAFRRPKVVFFVEPTLVLMPMAVMICKLSRIKTVLHVQDLEVDMAFKAGYLKNRFVRSFLLWLEKKILKTVDEIVTISTSMGGRIQKKLDQNCDIHIIRNWVDCSKIFPQHGPNCFRKALHIQDNTFTFLYAGNVGKKQALHHFLNAAVALESFNQTHFVVVGDGPDKKELENNYGCYSNISFLPVQPIERLNDLLNLADAHVLPQLSGIGDLVLPSKISGMLASGKLCIVAADPGTELREFLSGSAILVPAGNEEALREAMQYSAQIKPCFEQNQIKICENNFSSDVQLNRFSKIISGTIAL